MEQDSGLLPGRNPFLDLVPDPAKLSYLERVDVVRRLAGRWQAASDRESQWFGNRLSAWLSGPAGGDLLEVLDLKPPIGSHNTAPAVVARTLRDAALLALSDAAGGDRAALKVLQDPSARPDLAELVAQLASDPPRSPASFSRARDRRQQGISPHGG